MVNRKTRNIMRKTVRKMLCWAHYQFRQRLVTKAEELGVHVIIQNEAILQKLAAGYNPTTSAFVHLRSSYFLNTPTWIEMKMVLGEIFLRALLDGALILSEDHAGNNSNT
ncbi:9585_t:CDS:1 [Funneliformis geosporum]|nr:9585_t:CDS:1 [Funneliformis geosporum]